VVDRDRKPFDGPEARPLPPTNRIRWHGQLELRPALEKRLQRALALATRKLMPSCAAPILFESVAQFGGSRQLVD
jgi:hypothetical protein